MTWKTFSAFLVALASAACLVTAHAQTPPFATGSTTTTSTTTTTTTPAPLSPLFTQPGTTPSPSATISPTTTIAPFRPAPPLAPGVVPGATQPPVGMTNPQTGLDYSTTLRSEVFGANLFSGAFARQGATQFNPDYVIAVGDQVHLRLWGAYDFDAPLVVDPQGNIFIPHVGPVRLLGVRNQELQRLVEAAVKRTFRANVNSYASLAAAQPVRIFVGGNVLRPGLYSGTSMDSLLYFLDQAGGIDPDRGSFLAVQVKRGTAVRATVNLYDFLLNGTLPLVQLTDGDVVFVPPLQQTVRVSGLAQNPRRFEYSGADRTVADMVRLAKPLPVATHVRIVRSTGAVTNTEYYPLEDAARIRLEDGDQIEFTADKKPGTITVRVQGEHLSPQEYVLPYGTRLGELLRRIQYSERSDAESLQLFRVSVRERQRQMLHTSLRALEAAALTARSGTNEEAVLRKNESELLLQFVERARGIEPRGQVVIANAQARETLLLENGDVLNVPIRDGLVLVSGEVLFPNTVAYEPNLLLDDYIARSGGYTQNADNSRVVVARRDGSFVEANPNRSLFNSGAETRVRSGDEVLVLPKIDVKSRQIWKDMAQIVFQIAVIARVAVGL